MRVNIGGSRLDEEITTPEWLSALLRAALRDGVAQVWPLDDTWERIRKRIETEGFGAQGSRRTFIGPNQDMDEGGTAMTDWTNLHVRAVAHQHHEELLREAGKRRLLRQAATANPNTEPLRYRPLAWLGRRLIAWGSWLQQRYDCEEAFARMQPCGDAR